MIRLVIAADHVMVRESLAAALASVEDVEVLALAADGMSASALRPPERGRRAARPS